MEVKVMVRATAKAIAKIPITMAKVTIKTHILPMMMIMIIRESHPIPKMVTFNTNPKVMVLHTR
jgi:hypothetical protein